VDNNNNNMSRINGHNVGHFEIPAENVERLKDFYSSLFGWQFEKGQTQGYWTTKNAGISGGLMHKENPEQISTMFSCHHLFLYLIFYDNNEVAIKRCNRNKNSKPR
jgi:predicted enzyme related to lactoylglutathione lyase